MVSKRRSGRAAGTPARGPDAQVLLPVLIVAAGLVVYHNTLSDPIFGHATDWQNGHFRNNLFLSSISSGTLTDYTTLDYNGYMKQAGKP